MVNRIEKYFDEYGYPKPSRPGPNIRRITVRKGECSKCDMLTEVVEDTIGRANELMLALDVSTNNVNMHIKRQAEIRKSLKKNEVTSHALAVASGITFAAGIIFIITAWCLIF